MEHYTPRGIAEVGQVLSLSDDFLVYYDPDIDGGVSGRLACQFLDAFQKSYSVYINENRMHGFKLTQSDVASLRGKTVIVVDAGMTRAELEWITDSGVNVINIDHHHINEKEFVFVTSKLTGAQGVIINNQYDFEPEKWRFLSGAGVVFFVVNSLYPNLFGNDEKALVGLTLLSDVRPLGSDEANEFLTVTYTHASPLVNYLIDLTKPDFDFGFGVQTFDRNFIDYTFSPKINSLFRLNKGYEAIKVFNGSYTEKADLDVYRAVQNIICEDILRNLEGVSGSNLEVQSVPHDLALTHQNYSITNCVGLAASKHLTATNRTTLLYVEKDGQVLRGSVRGLCEDVDYLDIFRSFGFDAEGHAGAFGVKGFDKTSVDLVGLNEAIATAEHGYAERKYTNRVLEVNNLNFFMSSRNVAVANYNNFVRDSSRVLLKYTGSSIVETKRGKMTEFTVDGVKVMSFEEGLTPLNGLIMPLQERGKYINFYLKKY